MELVKDRSKSIKWFLSPVVGAADGHEARTWRKERDRSPLEGSSPWKRGAWLGAQSSHSGCCSFSCTRPPTCPQTQDPPGMYCCPVWQQRHRSTGTCTHMHRIRRQAPLLGARIPPAPTICARVHVAEPHSSPPHLCEEACTGANTQARLYLQVLRGQHPGSKTHTRAETTGPSTDWWTPVCSHMWLLKLGSTQTHTHTRTRSPTSTPTCALTHRETHGSRHACVTSTYSPVCLCSLWGLCAWHRGRHSGKMCRLDGHPEFQRGTSR